MPHFTSTQLHEMMSHRSNIRNLSVVAQVDAGKSTLTDSLVQKAGIIAKKVAGTARHTDGRKDEEERGITIKSTGVSMAFNYAPPGKEEKETFVLNVVDSPGHVDFSSEVTAALRVTDGALILVDCIDSVMAQTETVCRQAFQDKIKPCLMINKIDSLFMGLKMPPLDLYNQFRKVIEDVNVLLSQYTDTDLGAMEIDPRKGNVAFGSAKHQWAFTLEDFADYYAKQMLKEGEVFAEKKASLMKYLWGSYYYDRKKGKFTSKKPEEKSLPVFCELVLKPIYQMINAALGGGKDKVQKMLDKWGVKLDNDDARAYEDGKLKEGRLAKALMTNWLPMSDCVIKLIINHLPSPIEAQKYRAKYLYTGPEDDEVCKAMARCDPDGPVMMYVSKMIPEKAGSSRFWAFGRVFSGTIKAGTPYKIMGPNYVHGENSDVHTGKSQNVVTMMASKADQMPDIPCGNTCALVGVDRYLIKTGTISSDPEAYPIRDMKFVVAPVVQRAVAPKNGADLPKLVDGLRKLAKSDPSCLIIRDDETKENVIAGSGELHVEILINDLMEFMGKEVVISDPVVAYRETVIGTNADSPVLAKSKNGHNRSWVVAYGLEQGLADDITNGVVVTKPRDVAAQNRHLIEKHNMDPNDTDKRLWGFGPTEKDANILVNSTAGVQYLDSARDSMKSGFQDATAKGPLMNEPLYRVGFRVTDAKFHADSVHRGVGEVAPMTRKSCYGAFLTSQARVMEPMYQCSITIPAEMVGAIYTILGQRRAEVFADELLEGTPMQQIKAYLPVRESIGFDGELRGATSGKAFCQNNFSHYQVVGSDPYEEGTLAHEIVMEVRNRKKIGSLPDPARYIDRL